MKFKKDGSIPNSLEEIEQRGFEDSALVVSHNALNAVSLKVLQEVLKVVNRTNKALKTLRKEMELQFEKIGEKFELKFEVKKIPLLCTVILIVLTLLHLVQMEIRLCPVLLIIL